MSEQPTTPQTDNLSPLIPPHYLLILAGLGLLIGLFAALTTPTGEPLSVIGWGGLGIAVLGLLAWALMAPDQLMAVLKGRTLRFGGTAIIITAIFLVALVAVYVVVRQQNWRYDISETDTFSLTEDAREVIETIGADPTIPSINLLAFYTVADAGQRDRSIVLFDEYVEASGGKITYEFIDPDRNPQVAELYGVRSGQIAVVPLAEDGTRDVDNAETVGFFNQEEITNTIAVIASTGDFRAYVLSVSGGLSLTDTQGAGLSILNDILTDLKWTTREVTLTDLVNPQDGFQLNDPAADGEVLIVPGGSSALPDEVAKIITDYIAAGGDVIFFAAQNTEGGPTLLSADNLANFLFDSFGVRVRDDIVLDAANSFNSPVTIVVGDLATDNVIFAPTIFSEQIQAILMQVPHSIEIAPITPPNVTTTVLARTSSQSYAKTGVDLGQEITTDQLSRAAEDESGPFPVAVSVENSETGSRVVIFGSQDIPINQYQSFALVGIGNLDVALNSFFWTTRYDSFLNNIPRITPPNRPQDQPILADDQDTRTINIVSVVVLPFGLLGLGFLVRWLSRERTVEVKGRTIHAN